MAHLIGHPAEILIQCGCTAVKVVSPDWLIERFGLHATIERAQERLVCRVCAQRPTLNPQGKWQVTGGRDQRVDPPAMPDWVDMR